MCSKLFGTLGSTHSNILPYFSQVSHPNHILDIYSHSSLKYFVSNIATHILIHSHKENHLLQDRKFVKTIYYIYIYIIVFTYLFIIQILSKIHTYLIFITLSWYIFISFLLWYIRYLILYFINLNNLSFTFSFFAPNLPIQPSIQLLFS